MRVGKLIKYEPGQVTGDEVSVFLNSHFPDHDGSQRPEFTSGFIGLTRVEARKLAGMFDVELGDADMLIDMIPILDAAWLQGRFPIPKSGDDALTARVLAEVKREIKADPELMRALAAQVAQEGGGDATGPSPGATPPDDPASPPPPQKGMGYYLTLNWDALRRLAKERGLSAKQKREEILDALVAQDEAQPA